MHLEACGITWYCSSAETWRTRKRHPQRNAFHPAAETAWSVEHTASLNEGSRHPPKCAHCVACQDCPQAILLASKMSSCTHGQG